MSRACSIHGGEEEYTWGFGGKTRKNRSLEDLDVDGPESDRMEL
jgi:hypothetical protein